MTFPLVRSHALIIVALFGGMLASAKIAPAEDDAPDPAQLEASIAEHRMGTIRIETEPGTPVTIEQQKHAFWFGAALANGAFAGWWNPDDQRKYREVFLENFNAAVTENAVKWANMEPNEGEVNYEIVDAMLRWTEEHDIPLRGHCIFWGVPNRVQDWLKKKNDQQLREALKERALDVATRYRGRFAEYDLNNEMMHANYYADRLGPGITKDMADWVHQGDPGAVLFVNDYDVLTGNRLDDYDRHVRNLLDQGVAIEGIGVQGHLHGDRFDRATLQASLDRLAELDMPIRITEFNFPGQRSDAYRNRGKRLTEQEEQAKAKALVDYYRICFAHPAVEGILMWGFWEKANWIPASSLYLRDWTPTPAAEAYRKLVFETWWTDWQGKADRQGHCEVPAFYGTYRVKIGDVEKTVELTEENAPLVLSD